jgi:hypothetical protein
VTSSGVAYLRNARCRCAENLGASNAVAATTQGEEAPLAAPSSCDGRRPQRGIASAADLAFWHRIGRSRATRGRR